MRGAREFPALFLGALDLLLVAMLAARRRWSWSTVILGCSLAVPYIIANLIGARLFDPARAALPRVAYSVIAHGGDHWVCRLGIGA